MAPRSVSKTASMDIPKSRDAPRRHGMLPTPPSSISPCLNPQGFKHRVTQEVLHQYNLRSPPASSSLAPHDTQHEIGAVDSDIDLQDTEDRRVPSATTKGKADVSGDITPAMLARHHLPDILLAHGPLAIRHIMGYLTTSVPGFAMIPPAKARRLVVAGLEGKASLSANADSMDDGEVEFEKVGMGSLGRLPSWASRSGKGTIITLPLSVPATSTTTTFLCLTTTPLQTRPSSPIQTSTRPRDIDEPDKMSLDDDGVQPATHVLLFLRLPEEPGLIDGDWDEADMTDEEGWANHRGGCT
ncbi:hypothetical protein MGYG_01089 [Nannizzia gypsea CBS 118893]|uniref:Uncharacterized protein n=1 Tax=Arthroderma gypseum (strain ATCC MYA-4604 / CBS 118893) TaxID=535722 RepID=E5QYH5_ARTGP|nr:hypothetical protein MGYG_01089 [Nannizzia gypsea CBS 118893]EFQ98051.1 hypothetical protein MGYG_01089 [Nannizzia gypsea CBS 118893]